MYDVVQQLVQPEEVLLNTFHVDSVDIGRSFNTRAGDWYDVTLFDGSRAQYPASHSRMHTFLHSCGSIHQYLPDLIGAGLEIITRCRQTARA